MLALYRSERQAEALAAFAAARRVLASELGIEPGPQLRQMHAQILTADPGLDLAAGETGAGQPGDLRRPAKLAQQHHQRLVEQAARFQVVEQGGHPLI